MYAYVVQQLHGNNAKNLEIDRKTFKKAEKFFAAAQEITNLKLTTSELNLERQLKKYIFIQFISEEFYELKMFGFLPYINIHS